MSGYRVDFIRMDGVTMRLVWLDALRGMTISLVILNHCIIAAKVYLAQSGGELNPVVNEINSVLRLVRMPAFFLCSGILFSIPASRGWHWFLTKRLTWTVWVAAVWGWLSVLVISAGVNLNSADRDPKEFIGLQYALLEPVGNMWFIYAIAILGAYAMAIRTLSRTAALLLSVVLSLALTLFLQYVNLPEGLERLAWNLSVRGFIFFTIGFIFADFLMNEWKTNAIGFLAAIGIWFACYLVLQDVQFGRDFFRMALSIPATFSAIYALQFLFSRLEGIRKIFAHLGRCSLELFLLHQFCIAAVMAVLPRLGLGQNGHGLLAIMVAATMVLSYGAAITLATIPGNPLFSVPMNRRMRLIR